jgi:hypothetical protein
MPVYSGSLIDWIWFPLEPSVQGRKHQTAQAGDLIYIHPEKISKNFTWHAKSLAFLTE